VKLTDKKQEAIRRGVQAEALIHNPLLNDVLELINEKINRDWRAADSTPEEREKAFLTVCVMSDFQEWIKLFARKGRQATKELGNQQGKNDHV